MARIFLTGASGFLGRRTRQALLARGHDVVSLQRQAEDGFAVVVGDITVPSSFEDALSGSDVVVHLAALTGKAPDADYQRVNVDGTRAVIAAARRARVPRLLFCSTIAVAFADIRHYPYARSKVAGETLVRDSGLRTTTIRPTIIAGPGSPVMSKLAALSGLPLIPAFGGGHTRAQPILVDDLAELVADIVDADRFAGETLELGGRDVLTLRDLLARLRPQAAGTARFLSVPLWMLIAPLRIIEPILGHRLPMTIGQLATFRFDGVARPNSLLDARHDRLAPLDRLLEMAPAARPPLDLPRECQTFTRLLTGLDATPYVTDKYVAAHAAHPDLASLDGFDSMLVTRAASSPLMARLADGYARRAQPQGPLRKKLVLLLAILETSPGFHTRIDTARSQSFVGAIVSLGLAGAAGAATAVAGLGLFTLLRLVSGKSSSS